MPNKSDSTNKVNTVNVTNYNDDSPHPQDDVVDGKNGSPSLSRPAINTPTAGNNLNVVATDRKSSATPLETLRQSLATTRPLPIFRSSPEIPTETDDDEEELFSDAERQLIATDSVTATWKNVDSVYIGQLFKDYNVIPLGVRRAESPPPTNKAKVKINESENVPPSGESSVPDNNVSGGEKGAPPPSASPTGTTTEKKKVPPSSGADSDAYTSADENKAANESKKSVVGPAKQLPIDTDDPLIAAAQRNEPFDAAKCTTDSRIKEERLYARRFRIKQSKIADAKIADHLLSLASGDEQEPKDLMKEQDLSMANAQIERSDKQIFSVFEEGEVNLTNFTAGARKRYAQRRRYMQNELEKIQTMLEEEQMLFNERYAEINRRWPTTAAQHEQLDNAEALKNLLNEQKAACAERLELKQRVIQRLQDSLRLIDEHYSKSLRKQEQDLTDLSGNYSKVFKKLLSGFQDEMHAVEDVLYEDLHNMKEQFCAQYEDLRTIKLNDEVGVIEQRNLLKEEFDNELDGLRWNEADKFDVLKKKLESDVHTIEQQLMLMKAGFQMNAEKLDYNYQVLKRRDEENTILKAKQKRRITRLQDLLTKLRERQRKQEQYFAHDVEALSGDCSRLAQQIVDLHNKSKHFEKSDVEQFRNVWLVSELDIRHHVHHLLLMDRVISQQILGLDWQPPDMVWCLTEIGPIVAKKWLAKQQESVRKSSASTANGNKSPIFNGKINPSINVNGEKSQQKVHILLPAASPFMSRPLSSSNFSGTVNAHLNFTSRTREQLFNAFHQINVQKKLDHYFVKVDDDPNAGVEKLRNISPILLAHLYERIASETGYMVETKIVPIISQMAFHEQKHQKFVKFDSILRALGVGTSNDVLKLLEYFVKQLPPDVLKAHTTFGTKEKQQQKPRKKTTTKKPAKSANDENAHIPLGDTQKPQIIEHGEADENSSQTPQSTEPDAKPASTISVTKDEKTTDETGDEPDEKSSSTSIRSEDVDSPKKPRRELKPNELNELGLTLPSANTVVLSAPKQRHRKAMTKSRPMVALQMPPNLSPLEQAKWVKQQQQALATVEADDTNIAAIIQEENELISNATARESEQAKKRKNQLSPLGRAISPLNDEFDDDDDNENDTRSEMSTAKSDFSATSNSRKRKGSKKSKKKSKKSKHKKSRNRSKSAAAGVAQPPAANVPGGKTTDGAKIDEHKDDSMRLSDYIDPEYGCPDYMRVSEATTEILEDPMLNALVPLDNVLEILQQFIDDYAALEQERSKKSTVNVSSAKLRSTPSGKKEKSPNDNGTGIHRNDTADRPYFEQYLQMLDLELRLPIWRILFGKLHTFYIFMMERIKYRTQHGSQVNRNDFMLDELGALMTSEHASKLLVPALTTIVGDYRKRSKLLGNWRAGGDVDTRVLAKKKPVVPPRKPRRHV